MTIVVATSASDGIVLASDSRTIFLRGPLRYRVGTDYAQKLFAPYNGIGIAAYGTAVVGEFTIMGLMEQFVAEHLPSALRPSPSDLAVILEEFFRESIDALIAKTGQQPSPGILGFLIAGYSVKGIGQLIEVLLPKSDTRPAITNWDISTLRQGAIYRGRTRYIRRMMDGWDSEGGIEFVKNNIASATQEEISSFQAKYEQDFGMMTHPSISLQDALDYSCFVVRTTVDMERFTDGVRSSQGDIPVCGGRVQALIVRRDRTEWVVQNTVKLTPGGGGESP